MKEELLHYAWRARRLSIANLKTTQGQQLKIINFGQYNEDSGPDFKEAMVRIRDTTWAGHIEMHVNSSDWMAHDHQHDPAYENVILHVVWKEDQPIYLNDGTRLPCLEIRKLLDARILKNYKRIQHEQNWIPCERQLAGVDMLNTHAWLDRILAERFLDKAGKFQVLLNHLNGDWNEAFYITLARHFGFNKNAHPFEELAKRLPLRIIGKHANNPFQIESLLFGVGGMLQQDIPSDYGRELRSEYKFLQAKYNLEQLNPVMWQYLRMRPGNFPSLRIAQLAALLSHSPNPMMKVMETRELKQLHNWLSVSPPEFWDDHYHFHKESPFRKKKMGKASCDLLVINAIAPFLYLYGHHQSQQEWIERAMDLMQEIPSERNSIIQKWQHAGIHPLHAGHSQALLHLKKMYCDKRKCLQCAIGNEIIGGIGKKSQV